VARKHGGSPLDRGEPALLERGRRVSEAVAQAIKTAAAGSLGMDFQWVDSQNVVNSDAALLYEEIKSLLLSS
jgi:hypothetical protein